MLSCKIVNIRVRAGLLSSVSSSVSTDVTGSDLRGHFFPETHKTNYTRRLGRETVLHTL